MARLVSIVALGHSFGLNPGEIGGYPEDVAARLVRSGQARYLNAPVVTPEARAAERAVAVEKAAPNVTPLEPVSGWQDKPVLAGPSDLAGHTQPHRRRR